MTATCLACSQAGAFHPRKAFLGVTQGTFSSLTPACTLLFPHKAGAEHSKVTRCLLTQADTFLLLSPSTATTKTHPYLHPEALDTSQQHTLSPGWHTAMPCRNYRGWGMLLPLSYPAFVQPSCSSSPNPRLQIHGSSRPTLQDNPTGTLKQPR